VFKKIDYIYFYYMLCPPTTKQSKAKQMNTIEICVPRIKLLWFMRDRFVTEAFEAAYGEGSVRSISFIGCGQEKFYKLEVDIVCTTEQALDMRAKLNDGGCVFLDVPFHKYVGEHVVVKKHEWKLVKLSFDRQWRKKQGGNYHEWSRKHQLLQPVPASVGKLEQLLRETAECAKQCKSDVDDALLRAKAYATTQKDCTPSRSNELESFEADLVRTQWHINSTVFSLASACEQVPYMKSCLDNIMRLAPKS
jgi:hypothetical protein